MDDLQGGPSSPPEEVAVTPASRTRYGSTSTNDDDSSEDEDDDEGGEGGSGAGADQHNKPAAVDLNPILAGKLAALVIKNAR